MKITPATFFEDQFQERKNPFLRVFAVKLIYSTLAALIVGVLDPSAFDIPLDLQKPVYKFLLSVIFGPIFETFLFQVLILEVMRSLKIRDTCSVLVSGLIFALSHSYNMTYILVMFIPGIVYALYYVGLKRNRGWLSSAFFVFATHSLYNFIVFLANSQNWPTRKTIFFTNPPFF